MRKQEKVNESLYFLVIHNNENDIIAGRRKNFLLELKHF